MPVTPVEIRAPTVADAAAMWQLVRRSQVLDLNSAYCYLLMCEAFRDTCAVAVDAAALVGFVTGFTPPGRDDTLFVWQVGVDAARRGEGLATRLLTALLGRAACREVRFLEATVGPSNRASYRLFTALAERLDTRWDEQPLFAAELFPEPGHEAEILLRIGPFMPAGSLLGNSE